MSSSFQVIFHFPMFSLLKYLSFHHSLLRCKIHPNCYFLPKASQDRLYILMIPGSHAGFMQGMLTRACADQDSLLPKPVTVGGRGLMR